MDCISLAARDGLYHKKLTQEIEMQLNSIVRSIIWWCLTQQMILNLNLKSIDYQWTINLSSLWWLIAQQLSTIVSLSSWSNDGEIWYWIYWWNGLPFSKRWGETKIAWKHKQTIQYANRRIFSNSFNLVYHITYQNDHYSFMEILIMITWSNLPN